MKDALAAVVALGAFYVACAAGYLAIWWLAH